MKNNFLLYLAIALFISSCENVEHEKDNLNSFLKANYESNYGNYDAMKSGYNTFISEDPNYRDAKLDELDCDYKNLISKVDIAITNSTVDVGLIILDYDNFSRKIDKYARDDKNYLIPHINLQEQSIHLSNELCLNIIKNRSVIQMVYYYEFIFNYSIKNNAPINILPPDSHVRSNITKVNNDRIKLILSNKYAQLDEYPNRVIITDFRLNGENKKFNYTLDRNYDFADIVLDSLTNGNYELDGVLRFYEGNGEFDLPFSENFILE